MKSQYRSLLIAATASLLMVVSIAEETGAIEAKTASAQNPQRRAIDVVVTTSIDIDRSTAIVWHYLIDSNAWTRLKLIHRDGPVGQAGEIFSIVDPAKPKAVMHIAENLELIPNRRRSIKVYDADGPLRGYAIWSVNELHARTTVTYDVYYETVLPPRAARPVSTDQALFKQRQESENLTKQRLDVDLIALKRLVESK